MQKSLVALLAGVVGVMLGAGCASKPVPAPSPTKQEVMSDADRFFEKMKEDELSHGPLAPSKPL